MLTGRGDSCSSVLFCSVLQFFCSVFCSLGAKLRIAVASRIKRVSLSAACAAPAQGPLQVEPSPKAIAVYSRNQASRTHHHRSHYSTLRNHFHCWRCCYCYLTGNTHHVPHITHRSVQCPRQRQTPSPASHLTQETFTRSLVPPANGTTHPWETPCRPSTRRSM